MGGKWVAYLPGMLSWMVCTGIREDRAMEVGVKEKRRIENAEKDADQTTEPVGGMD